MIPVWERHRKIFDTSTAPRFYGTPGHQNDMSHGSDQGDVDKIESHGQPSLHLKYFDSEDAGQETTCGHVERSLMTDFSIRQGGGMRVMV